MGSFISDAAKRTLDLLCVVLGGPFVLAMLRMYQINYIRDLHSCGYSAKEIKEKTNADTKTIRKYLNQNDFLLKTPIKKPPSILNEFKETINIWLKECKKNWYKQQQTAKRAYDSLVSECGFNIIYSVVQCYLKAFFCNPYAGYEKEHV